MRLIEGELTSRRTSRPHVQAPSPLFQHTKAEGAYQHDVSWTSLHTHVSRCEMGSPPHPPALRHLLRPSSAAARSDRLLEPICTGGKRTWGAQRDSTVELLYCSLPCSSPPRRDGVRRLGKHPPHTLRLRLSLLLQAGRVGAAREGRPPYESAEGICACAVLCTSKKTRESKSSAL